ncbi:MAG: AAA family ATPase, partial [Clostridiales bacterium]|nr:AAA family ATPase [Clostridiales bacterium]
MVNATTVNKLNELRLNGMAESFNSQLCDSSYNDLSFEDRFG